MQKNKGQLSILATLIIAGSTIIASALGAWATANSRVDEINTQVQVIQERENNHYAELSKKLDSIDKKLDEVLQKK